VFDDDRNSVDWRLEQIAERRSLLGAGQGHFEALKVGSDQLVASPEICRRGGPKSRRSRKRHC
jgi:hypothetical protein